MQLLAFSPGPLEIIVVIVIALLLFGRRIPLVARNLGRGINEFKHGLKDPPTEPKDDEEH